MICILFPSQYGFNFLQDVKVILQACLSCATVHVLETAELRKESPIKFFVNIGAQLLRTCVMCKQNIFSSLCLHQLQINHTK
jgi:hypothetical protein